MQHLESSKLSNIFIIFINFFLYINYNFYFKKLILKFILAITTLKDEIKFLNNDSKDLQSKLVGIENEGKERES